MERRSFIFGAISLSALVLPISSQVHKNNKGKGVSMIIHAADTRGVANHGWLNSHHSFSFADYYNPQRMGFGALRVINDDSVAAAAGFGRHPHRDMEIISIPLEGSLSHQDSEGNSSIIRNGEVQIMSAGTGIFHSEMNASTTDPVKFLQIWVLPKKMSVKPRYEQKAFEKADRNNKLQMVVSPDGRDGSITINQDAFFSLAQLDSGKSVTYERQLNGNGVYVFILKGDVELNGETFHARDGIGVKDFESLELIAKNNAEVLLMEVPV